MMTSEEPTYTSELAFGVAIYFEFDGSRLLANTVLQGRAESNAQFAERVWLIAHGVSVGPVGECRLSTGIANIWVPVPKP